MNPQERVLLCISHKEPDRVPIDLGSISVSGMSRAALISLQLYLGGAFKILYRMLPDTDWISVLFAVDCYARNVPCICSQRVVDDFQFGGH